MHVANCHKNIESLSRAMETEAVQPLWGRSTEKRYRYETFLSDGNASAYRAVCLMNDGDGPYGETKLRAEAHGNTTTENEGRPKGRKVTNTGKIIKKPGRRETPAYQQRN